MQLPAPIHTNRAGRAVIRTTDEALRLIDDELTAELRALPRWTFARDLLLAARMSQKSRDLKTAVRQFKQALSNEGWLADD
jgi:hypothetical protein